MGYVTDSTIYPLLAGEYLVSVLPEDNRLVGKKVNRCGTWLRSVLFGLPLFRSCRLANSKPCPEHNLCSLVVRLGPQIATSVFAGVIICIVAIVKLLGTNVFVK